MFGMFSRKAKEAQKEFKKMENRDTMQACVGVAFLVAYADGELEDSELKVLEGIISSHPAFQGFGPELGQTMNKFEKMFEDAGVRMGRRQVEREIKDIGADEQALQDVFDVALSIAEADGEIEPEEVKELERLAKLFGVDLKDFM